VIPVHLRDEPTLLATIMNVAFGRS
jgi:hypothetical protein